MNFLNSASYAAALVFYLPGVCTHTDTKGKQRKTRVLNNLKSLEKTQNFMNTLYVFFEIDINVDQISIFSSFYKITPHMHSFKKCFEQQRRKTMIQTERRDDIDRKKIFFLNQESNFESVSFVIIHLSVFVMQFLSNILQNEIY